MDLTYKAALRESMTMLGRDPLTRFVGYGLKTGHEKSSFAGVPATQLAEFTVAEGVMTSAAIGMSLMGLKPIVYFERCDFLLNALDAIVNHLDACRFISNGEFRPTAILRIVVGNRENPLFTGHTHTRDHSNALRNMVNFPVICVHTAEEVMAAYQYAYANFRHLSCAIVEYKDLIK
jgi:hypothetical protein